jgi:hypothetical protein
MDANRVRALKDDLLERRGNTITLSGSPPLKAMRVDDQRVIRQYTSTDGLEAPEALLVVFIFSGAVFEAGTVKRQTIFTSAGTRYRVQSTHEQIYEDVCVEYPVVVHLA